MACIIFPTFSYANDVAENFAKGMLPNPNINQIKTIIPDDNECFVSFEKYKTRCNEITFFNHVDYNDEEFQAFDENGDYIYFLISKDTGKVKIISNNVFAYPHPENVSCDISFGENEMTCRLKNSKENRIIFHYYASTNITRLK